MACLVNKDLLPGIIADSGLMKYAFGELKALGYTSASDGIDGMLYNDVIELLAVFVSQGHSNNSAPIILNMFQRLAMFQPLSPLRFTDDEWVEFADGKFQNIRRSCFFKESPHDRVYTIEGYTKCSSRRREFGSSEITDGTGLCWSGGGFQRCSKCHSILPLSEFTSSSGRVDYYCKECRKSATDSSRSAASSAKLCASSAELKKAMSVEVPAAKVVARNGVPTSESKLPRRLRRLAPPLAADAVPGSSDRVSSVDVFIESGVCSDLSDTRGINPLFEGISSEELFSELEARGFALDGVYRLRVIRERVVR